MSLNPSDITRLYRIFEDLGWYGADNKKYNEKLFENFCVILARLDSEQRDLMLNLTSKFIKIDFNKYVEHLLNAMNPFPFSSLNADQPVFVLPLRAPRDTGKTKSATALPYFFINSILKNITTNDNPVYGLDSHYYLKEKHPNRKNSVIFALDDFIGSGDTANQFLDDMEKEVLNETDKLIICTISILQTGFKSLTERGYDVFYSILQKKGISDELPENYRRKAIKLMIEIERKIGVSENYQFGYKQSEAMITLARTPNNTFPVYWWSAPNGKNAWPAPFPRK